MRAAVDGRLQYHLIAGIAELRSPPVVHLDRFGEKRKAVEKGLNLPGGEARRETVLCELAAVGLRWAKLPAAPLHRTLAAVRFS
jgi:hypothetical protein